MTTESIKFQRSNGGIVIHEAKRNGRALVTVREGYNMVDAVITKKDAEFIIEALQRAFATD